MSEDELRARLLFAETRIVQLQRQVDATDAVATKRQKQSPNKRNIIFLASGAKCFYCSCEVQRDTFTIDHVWSLARGGTSILSNMVAACSPCNSEKGDSLPTEGEIMAAETLYRKPSRPIDPERHDRKARIKREREVRQDRIARDPGMAFMVSQARVGKHRVKQPRRGRNVHFGSSH